MQMKEKLQKTAGVCAHNAQDLYTPQYICNCSMKAEEKWKFPGTRPNSVPFIEPHLIGRDATAVHRVGCEAEKLNIWKSNSLKNRRINWTTENVARKRNTSSNLAYC